MNITITGGAGFIGSHLAEYLKSQGHTVYGLSRGETINKTLAASVSGYRRWQLDEPFEGDFFAGMEAVVHCAHALTGPNLETVTIRGTKKLSEAAKNAGVRIQIYLTSYSAKEGTRSEYARIKFCLENHFLSLGQPVIRPGLVLGRGGLFQRMVQSVRRYPVLPLIDGGNQLVPIVFIGTLCAAINRILDKPNPGIYNIFQNKLMTMRELIQSIKRSAQARCLLLPVPAAIPLVLLKLLEVLRIPSPIKSDSILALQENQELGHRSSLPDLGLGEVDIPDLLDQMCCVDFPQNNQ